MVVAVKILELKNCDVGCTLAYRLSFGHHLMA